MKLSKVLSARVRALREAAGMSQQDLAVKADLSLSQGSKLEQGKKADPRASTLLALSSGKSPDSPNTEISRPSASSNRVGSLRIRSRSARAKGRVRVLSFYVGELFACVGRECIRSSSDHACRVSATSRFETSPKKLPFASECPTRQAIPGPFASRSSPTICSANRNECFTMWKVTRGRCVERSICDYDRRGVGI